MRVLGIAFMLVSAQAALAVPAEVVLRPETAVAGAHFTLGEIAEVRSGDEALARELRALRIGQSPRAGGALALERGAVERWLAKARRGAVRVLGADAAVVRRGPLQSLAMEQVVAEAEQALRRALSAAYGDLVLSALRSGKRALVVPVGDLHLHARRPAPLASSGRATVWVDVTVGGQLYQSVPVAFGVSGQRPVRVARRQLSAGQRVGPADFDVRRIDAAALREAPLPPEAGLEGLRLTRSLRAGEALSVGALAPAHAVRRDEEIQVRAAAGAVAVETTAVATRDALPGDVIRVRTDNGDMYAVRVLGPGAAEAAGSAR